ncbi:MAG: hypothetical protein PVH61_13445 [Candidatus Aminicenantes bacterium]|jgi:hypothetical protein
MAEITEKLTHPLLPKLKAGKGNKMEGFTQKGIWLPRPSTELDVLSDSVSTEEVEFEVNSIPDMWGRPILFELALFDPAHPIHHRVMGEWRGMLAMLALRNMRQFTGLAVKEVKLPKRDPQMQDNGQLDFLTTLSKIMPEKNLANDSSWDHLYVILFGGRPIGMTTPITLVCTATDYFNSIRGVQWYSGRFLLDPIRFLNKDEKNALAFWLEKFKNSIDHHDGIKDNTTEYERMLEIVDDFIKDLGGVHDEFELSNIHLGMRHGIFEYLDNPVVGGFGTEREEISSHVHVLSSREPAPTPALLVVDQDIARQWGCGEQEVLVYSQIPLARIPPEGLLGSKDTIFETTLENARWCTPDEFFSEKLVLIQQKDAFPGILHIDGSDKLLYRNRLVTPIIPISDLLLKYLEPQDIANRMRFEQIGSDEIRVYLNLPLSGIHGIKGGEDFEINKSYSFKKKDIIVQMAVPILELWPDFVSPTWEIYFSYFSSTDKDKVFYATPIKQDDTEAWEKAGFKNKDNQTVKEIIRLDHFPEAYECKTYWKDQNKRRVTSDAGILLLAKPEQVKPVGKTYNIGVDFGTSGTNIYFQEGQALPKRIVFDEHFFKISAAPTLERVELYDYFLPPLKEEMPFLSIFHDFLNNTKDLEPVLDGHIYFPYDPKEFNAGDDKKRMDMKWGKPEERDRARTFLEQLCLMGLVEAARDGAEKISWRFAFPTAFSQSDEEAIKVNWRIISDKILKLTGLKADDRNLHYDSEAVASASYFANSTDIKAAIPRGAVFIDIGGTTSDISIWGGGNMKLVVQTSLRFAGRNMFSNPLWEKTRKTTKKKENYFLSSFFKEEDIDALYRDKVKNNPIAFYAQLDSIVSAENKYIRNRLPNLSNDEKTNEFKQILAIGISGLLYYVGLVIKNIPDRQQYIDSAPNIYWGGNGSRLLHWLAGGHFSPDSAINRLLKAVFRKASGIAPESNFEINVSPEPKAEVAYGLVWDKTPLKYDKDKVREGFFLAGETFVDLDYNKDSNKNESAKKDETKEAGKNKGIYQWNHRLTPTLISKGIKLLSENGNFKMDRLEDFIKTFNENADNAAVPRIPENPLILQETGDHVNHECAKLRNTKEEEIHVEPLFITAIKKFLDELVKDWASK